MRELALHILDIVENSVSAQAQNITICVQEDYVTDRLSISVQDDGKGMDAETVAGVIDPFVTSRTTRKVGLGIPLLKAAAEMCDGSLAINSKPGSGTLVSVDFQLSHIDRMPLGDLADTFLSLLVAHPETHWVFSYRVIPPQDLQDSDMNSINFDLVELDTVKEFYLDDQPIKETLEDIPLCDPTVLAYLRDVFQNGIRSVM
jgi:hypothetical protein